jgi:NAD(P)-dependent dehydrogenase (short-subunit alcohol dehydrogenase family)
MPRPWTSGRHVLITGASSGIGRGLAGRLVLTARRLTLVSRNSSGMLERTAAELREIGRRLERDVRIEAHAADVLDFQRAAELIEYIYGEDHVDAFVSCAGGSHHYGSFETLSREDIDRIFDVNAKGPIYWLHALLPRMRQNPVTMEGGKRGHIVLLSSRSGERALPHLGVYAAAKGALLRLLDAMRSEYAAHRIAFTSVCPGSVDTAFTAAWPAPLKAAHEAESMNLDEAVDPIVALLDAAYAVNHLSYESVEQWLGEPGVARGSSA